MPTCFSKFKYFNFCIQSSAKARRTIARSAFHGFSIGFQKVQNWIPKVPKCRRLRSADHLPALRGEAHGPDAAGDHLRGARSGPADPGVAGGRGSGVVRMLRMNNDRK